MVSRIVEHQPQQHLFIEHIGILKDGKAIRHGDEVEPWAGAREDYYFTALPGDGCRVDVQMDSQQEWTVFFSKPRGY